MCLLIDLHLSLYICSLETHNKEFIYNPVSTIRLNQDIDVKSGIFNLLYVLP